MGTELQRRGYDTSLPLWSARALIESPDAVRQIHQEYADAGADVMVTNSFRTHRRNLAAAGVADRAEELTRLSVRLASGLGCRVAGSISPLFDCYTLSLSIGEAAEEEHVEFAGWLVDEGLDLLLIETMPTVAEALAALRASKSARNAAFQAAKTNAGKMPALRNSAEEASNAGKMPALQIWVSLVPEGLDPVRTLDGKPLADAILQLVAEAPDAVLVNCAAMEVIEAAVAILSQTDIPFGGYANNGSPSDEGGWRFDKDLPVEDFATHCQRLKDLGATIIGGCCGTTPQHIKKMSESLKR
jgi:S-methylmethionine-dependent homocysteine/selenocysteine methylase